MKFEIRVNQVCALLAGLLLFPSTASAETPPIATALGLTPVQRGVEFDRPAAGDVASCTITSEKIGDSSAWVVRDPSGVVIRRFSDSNEDNVVDIWSYFSQGLEVYRDVDSNHNGKADSYRWFHTAGSRIGLDPNEDGKIDSWQRLSPEEMAEQVVESLKSGDTSQFSRLLLSVEEARKLGLSREVQQEIAERSKSAKSAFEKLSNDGKFDEASEFSDFGGLRPGMVPAGVRGSTKDVLVYENAWAMVYTGDDHTQLRLGAMVEVDGVWKLIDAPTIGADGQTSAGFFFNVDQQPQVAAIGGGGAQPNEEMQELLTRIEKLDQQLASASKQRKPALNQQRAELLERLASIAPNSQEQRQWLRQLADMVGNAYQMGEYPKGAQLLKKWEEKLGKTGDSELAAHFLFQRMLAEYGMSMSEPDANHVKIQEAWIEQLEKFVEDHKDSSHVAEALIQLAMNSEFSGETDEALRWYQQIVGNYPDNENAAKARGAVTRLRSEGRGIKLAGRSLQGRQIDLQKLRGSVVLIQYWATLENAGANDHAELKDIYAKYGGNRFTIVGVNLDYNRDDVVSYLRSNPLPWQQLYEPSGFEGRLATEMGVMTAPLMMLVGPDGKVVSRDIQLAELETELKKLTSERVSRRN